MADDVTLPGTGDVVAADDIGSKKYQRIKLIHGADGVNAGDVSSANPLPVGGNIVRISGGFTRPGNTTNYTANDVVSDSTGSTTLITLANAVRANGGNGYIVRVALHTDKISITPGFNIHFFRISNPTRAVDNSAHKEVWGDNDDYIGTVALPSLTTPKDIANSTVAKSANSAVRLSFVAASGATSIYALVECTANFAPNNGQLFKLYVDIDQNA